MEKCGALLSSDIQSREVLLAVRKRLLPAVGARHAPCTETERLAAQFPLGKLGLKELQVADEFGRTVLHHVCRARPAPLTAEFESGFSGLNAGAVGALLGIADRSLITPVMLSLLMDAVYFSSVADASELEDTLDMISEASDYLLKLAGEAFSPVDAATNRNAPFVFLLNACDSLTVATAVQTGIVCALVGAFARWNRYCVLDINAIDQSGCTVLDVLVSLRPCLSDSCY
jgi:hypothetical protein